MLKNYQYQIEEWNKRSVGFNVGLAVGDVAKLLARVTVTLAALKYLFWG